MSVVVTARRCGYARPWRRSGKRSDWLHYFTGGLEAEGFIVLAGLVQESTDVLFIFHAESENQVRNRLSVDPWQQDGHARLVRLEKIAIRTGAPQPRPDPRTD